jgi:hypothetical protein
MRWTPADILFDMLIMPMPVRCPNALPLAIHLGGHVRDACRHSQKEGFAQ